jgi:biotin carboxyl carrier protein
MTDYQFQSADGGEPVIIRLEKDGPGFIVTVGSNRYQAAQAEIASGELRLILDGRQIVVPVVKYKGVTLATVEGTTYRLERFERIEGRRQHRRQATTGASIVEASMPGTILEILVAEDDQVQQGQPVIILEAMKMELRLAAPIEGRIEKILVQPGELVQQGMILLTLSKD